MESSQTYENLSSIADKRFLPVNESQVRPMNAVKEIEKQIEIWTEAVERSDGKMPTAAVVQKVVDEVNGRGKPKKTRPYELRKKEIRQALSSALPRIPVKSLTDFHARLADLLAEFLPQESEDES
jgi:hypothetical protein